MSTDSTNPLDPSATPEDQQQQQKPNNIEAMERKNRELLGLVKKYKDELQSVKKVMEEVKQAELEKQGKYTDLYKQTAEELARVKAELEKERESFKHDKIRSHIARKALEKGAQDVDVIYRLLDPDDYAIAQLDERGQVDDNSIEQLLTIAAQRTKLELFKPRVPQVKDAPIAPSHKVLGQQVTKPVKEMSLAELTEAYKKLRR